jgi:hypothetical protein
MKANHKYSILQGKEKYCWVTGARSVPLQKHHVFYGNNLHDISDKHGFWVYLLPDLHKSIHHTEGNMLGLMLKRECQKAYEDWKGHEAFMKLIGRNYVEEEDDD